MNAREPLINFDSVISSAAELPVFGQFCGVEKPAFAFVVLNQSLPETVRIADRHRIPMTPLSIFGLFAVTAMLVCYALEARSRWFILAFAVSCALGSAYGFLQGAWPFGIIEAVWSLVALRRWARASLK